MKIAGAIVLLSAALALSGCQSVGKWPAPILTYTHAATPLQARTRVGEWVMAKPATNTWGHAAGTGSMRPHITGGPREFLLFEKFTAQPLHLGQVVSFSRDATTPRCLHMIADIRGDYFYITGTNNRWSDGWFHRSKVTDILREVVTLPAEGTR